MADPRFGLGLRLEAGNNSVVDSKQETAATTAAHQKNGIFAVSYKRSPGGLVLPAEQSGGVTLGDTLVRVNGVKYNENIQTCTIKLFK